MSLDSVDLDLNIEELVLRGFPGRDQDRIKRAVRAELERLIRKNGIPTALSRGGEMASLDGGSFEAKSGSSPEEIGAQVARSLYGGLR
ncbi:MAG: hypothetical protein PHS80_01250 [Methanothrix sp.]|nr:hypothetical protein [Methanothrix sp.]MDD4447307.1 hypothetical protein [Methanothrix sp.]